MPVTLSQPAAIALLGAPARRAGVPIAALAIGAMSPDFEFFLHLRPLARWSHSLTGLLTFCLPVGLVALALWEWLMRAPVRDLLGFPTDQRRTSPEAGWWLRAALGVIVGAATHLAWDGFTHGGYWGVQLLPVLREPAFMLRGGPIPWFNVLQHTSTVGGGFVVLGRALREARRAGAFPALARPTWRWAVIVAIPLGALAVGLLNGERWAAQAGCSTIQVWLGRVAVAALQGFGVALIVYSIAYHAVRPSRRSASS